MTNPVWQWFLNLTNQTLWLALLAAFFLGMIIGRFLHRRREKKLRSWSREGDKAFFKGIQYILANDPDHAIEEFIKSVRINSDTIETYVALGNLYRSKGDIDRAIRIRQSIILRPSVEEQIKVRALLDLGLDYLKGGFFNRALETLGQVLRKEPSNLEALIAVEKIHVELKDWENAFSTRQKIAKILKGDHAHILAHYQTEKGKIHQKQGELGKAKSAFEKGISMDDRCLDAYLHLGDLHFQKQDYKKAIASWRKVVDISPSFTFLAYRRLEGAYSKMKNLKPVEEFLKECAESYPDPFTHTALARYRYNEQDRQAALKELDAALDLAPSFWEARKLQGEILLEAQMKEEALRAYRNLIAHLTVPYLSFQCSQCGYMSSDLQWQCPQCKQWDTIGLMKPALSDSNPEVRPTTKNLPVPPQDNPGEKT
ncbi:MAG: tetratricopeptide repeat protein [Deltaproteobacteria bacterium]|nr:tetratricopeptide repeat protein [Deltaproteobacteria bacterium]